MIRIHEHEKATVDKAKAIDEVRLMASQFADLYFAFVNEIRRSHGDTEARRIVRAVLFKRARERAERMAQRADSEGIPREPENIPRLSDVAFMGWVPELGADHCPYGAQWKRRIAEHPWFREYAALYCDVTDTTLAEFFTGSHTHELIENIVLGDERCSRRYFPSRAVAEGRYTYAPVEGQVPGFD